MTDIEIPFKEEKNARYRFFEILPGALSWTMLAMPFILSFINVTVAAFFVIGYLLIYFFRAVGISIRALQGHSQLQRTMKLDWRELLRELREGHAPAKRRNIPKWHRQNLRRVQARPLAIDPKELLQVAMIAMYNESREVVEPTIKAVIDSNYDTKQIMLMIAYEERGGARTKKVVQQLIKKYGKYFYDALAVEHPADIPGELIGKGGNITFAGRKLAAYAEEHNLDPLKVIVTTLDADNRPHKEYFAALSYVYVLTEDPLHVSYQPVSIYTNNIWDAPAPMRVLATGNTYYNTVLSLRPHLLRNFSAHAQPLASLLDTDFWSVRTIVEDGHQFWRTYFRYDGNHQVYPIYVPIYQDAVLADTYPKTLKAQFIQLRRWTWGASDIAYFADKGFFKKNKVPRFDLWMKFGRLLEGHVTWAIAPVLLAFAAFVPVLFNPDNFAANQLPIVVSYVQTIALLGALASIYVCFKTLPPRPARYTRKRTVFMVLQWAYMPILSLVYMASAALYSQTRLMFGKYLDKFDVTVKSVVSESADGKISRRS